MDPRIAKAFANIALDSCLALGEGDRLRINTDIAHRPLVHLIADEAWKRGARAVRVLWNDGRLARSFYDHAQDRFFDEVGSWVEPDSKMYAGEGWCSLSLVGDEDPRALDGVNPALLQRQQRVASEANKAFRTAVRNNSIAWSVLPVPTEAWARSVFAAAGRDPGPDPAAALWEVLGPILHLDRPDPAASLRAHLDAIAARARLLTEAGFSEIHFTGPGTDFRVGLSPRSRWAGGGSKTPDGRFFAPNHPTEETFTSPDNRRAEGRIACTRPVKVLGESVEGGWFEFREGRVVESGARKGAETLARFLDVDPGARRLGEVALVDAMGPIWKSGLVFDNILIDENAASHIALGAAYFDVFEGSAKMTPEELAEAGFNESLVHVDFMVGSDEVDVEGLDSRGRTRPILRKGSFVL